METRECTTEELAILFNHYNVIRERSATFREMTEADPCGWLRALEEDAESFLSPSSRGRGWKHSACGPRLLGFSRNDPPTRWHDLRIPRLPRPPQRRTATAGHRRLDGRDVTMQFRVAGAADVARRSGHPRGSAWRGRRRPCAASLNPTDRGREQARGQRRCCPTREALANTAEIVLIRRVELRSCGGSQVRRSNWRRRSPLNRIASTRPRRAARTSNRRPQPGEIGSRCRQRVRVGAALIGGAVGGINAAQAVRDQMGLEERAALLRNASGIKDFDSIAQVRKIAT